MKKKVDPSWKRDVAIAYIIMFIGMALVIVGLSGCSPRIIEHVRTEIEYRDLVQKDSVFLRDSIWQKEYIKGDTVYLDKYVYKYIYKDKFKTDSVYVAVHDTTTVEKLVEKQLTTIQKAKQNSFWWLVLAVLALLVYTFRKPIGKCLSIIIK